MAKIFIKPSLTLILVITYIENWELMISDLFRDKAKELIKKKGGTLASDEDEATHVIHPRVELNTDLYAR